MIKHTYQHWYSQYLHLADWQLNLLLALALIVASLSVLNPKFLRKAVMNTFRWLLAKFSRRPAGEGVVIAGEFVPDSARLRHTHIVGSTGTGKTVLMEQLIYEDLNRGYGALIIDPKGDRELYGRVREYCRRIGRSQDLKLISATHSEESVRWNPCRLGSAAELQTKWFSSGIYGEPFYAKACELGLLQAFNALERDHKGGAFCLAHVVSQLERLSVSSKNPHMEGLFFELKNFSEGEWGEILCAAPPQRGSVDLGEVSLLDITRKNEVLFVDLPIEAKALQSSRVGKLLLQEMMLISGLRKLYPELKNGRPFSVYVDEFDAFATEPFVTFLNKARSSNIMIHIAHQTLSDLKKVSDTFEGQIIGNCNNLFAFRLNHPDDAETVSKMFGTRTSVKQTYQSDGDWRTGRASNRDTEEFLIHPNEIKSLKIGECIFSMKTERVLRRLRIPAPKADAGRKRKMPTERGPTAAIPVLTQDVGKGASRIARVLRENTGKAKQPAELTPET